MNETSVLDRATRRASAAAATRYSRRSFFERVGRYAIVVTATSAGAQLLMENAYATCGLQCDCSGGNCNANCSEDRVIGCDVNGHSVTCKGLTGVGGTCPANSFACGTWYCSCASCSSNTKMWVDCCGTGQCDHGSSCACHGDVDGCTRPTCCYKKCWNNGGGSCSHYIVCRYGVCT